MNLPTHQQAAPLVADPVRRSTMSDADFQEWLAGVLPDIPTQARERAWDFLEKLWRHTYHEDALREAGLVWGDLYSCMRCPAYAAEYEAVKALLEIRRQVRRMDEADRRAMDGWLEPVFGRDSGKDAGTVQVGEVRRFSDRLLELQLKAGDRARYSERVEHAVSGAILHYHSSIERHVPEANTPARDISAEVETAPESAEKAQTLFPE